jgi:hypothetical protein
MVQFVTVEYKFHFKKGRKVMLQSYYVQMKVRY